MGIGGISVRRALQVGGTFSFRMLLLALGEESARALGVWGQNVTLGNVDTVSLGLPCPG